MLSTCVSYACNTAVITFMCSVYHLEASPLVSTCFKSVDILSNFSVSDLVSKRGMGTSTIDDSGQIELFL